MTSINLILNYDFFGGFFPYTGEIILLMGILTLLVESLFLSTSNKYLLLIDYSSKLAI